MSSIIPIEEGEIQDDTEDHKLVTSNTDLEEHLNIIFQQKLEFPFENPEVVFVQTAIENIVTKIVTTFVEKKDLLFEKVGDPDVQERLQPTSGDIICKAGSFYERTKNTYPNEFDFLYAPYCIELTDQSRYSFLKIRTSVLGRILDDLNSKGCLEYRDSTFGTIKYQHYVGQHGPASNVRFCFYRNPRRLRKFQKTEKEIDVDLVPGIRVIDPNLSNNISKVCPIPGFRDHVLTTGEYFWVPYSLTALNKTEVHFMRHVLSKKHVKAYRLLKYVINGDGDADDLAEECVLSIHHIKCLIPSYAIKTAMINHHFQCQDHSDNVGGCIIEILEWFKQSFADPKKKMKDNFAHHHVDIVAPANKIMNLATGQPDLIRNAEKNLGKVIEYLKSYHIKSYGHDSGIDSFATHMVLSVVKYNEKHGPWYRRYSYVLCHKCGINLSGQACFNAIIAILIIIIVFVFAYVFYPRKEEL